MRSCSATAVTVIPARSRGHDVVSIRLNGKGFNVVGRTERQELGRGGGGGDVLHAIAVLPLQCVSETVWICERREDVVSHLVEHSFRLPTLDQIRRVFDCPHSKSNTLNTFICLFCVTLGRVVI